MPRPALGLAIWALAAAVAGPSARQGPTPPASRPLDFVLSSNGLPMGGRWKSTPVTEDVNGDGSYDLISQARLENGPHVWLGDGKGAWSPSISGLELAEGSCGGGVAVADIDRDGHRDLAVADHCKGVWVYRGDGTGKWHAVVEGLGPAVSSHPEWAEIAQNPFRGAEDLALGDVDGDKRLDIVACSADRGGFTLYVGEGSCGSWKEKSPTGLPTADAPGEGRADEGGWCRDVVLHDMNRDGHLDVVASYHRGPRVWLGDGRGQFRAASDGMPASLLNGLTHQIFVADANGDGRPDVAAANQINGSELFLQNDDGSWRHAGDLFPPMRGGAYSVAIGDLDGDARADVVTGGRMEKNGRFGIYALRGDGQGRFTPFTTNLPDRALEVVWGLALADIDRDTRLDVVATLGGAVGQAPEAERRLERGKVHHVQVWLNRRRN